MNSRETAWLQEDKLTDRSGAFIALPFPRTARATLPPLRQPNHFRGPVAKGQTLIGGVLRSHAIFSEILTHPVVELYISFRGLLSIHK